jgi:hypothetical protein
MMAKDRGLDGFVTLHKSKLNEPFKLWNPAFVGACQMDLQLQYKTLADVVEALLAAHLLDGGPAQGDAFLRWVGLPVACPLGCDHPKEATAARTGSAFSPSSSPYAWPLPERECLCWKDRSDAHWKTFGLGPVSVSPTPATVARLAKLESTLGYSFRNKWLLLQSLTHPSYGRRPWPLPALQSRRLLWGIISA